jgi:LacI family transcriptional regulator
MTWLESLPRPVGLMACNDPRARHVLEACQRLGLTVPGDVAVLGVDNDQLICELTRPPLSSIDQSARRIGYEAASLLDRMMTARREECDASEGVPTKVVVPPIGVVARVSTDTLASDDQAVVTMLRGLRSSPWQKPSVAKVAAAHGLSPGTLEQRFHNAVGRSIHAEFVRYRMQRLRRLVVETDLPLKTIAAQAGFPSLQYMTTFVRRHTGTTPARLRAMERDRFAKGTS